AEPDGGRPGRSGRELQQPVPSPAVRSILVTGGTGTLGKLVVERLVAVGCRVTVLTRQPRPGGPARQLKGDLITGEGLAAAVAGVDTYWLCSTGARVRRVEQTRA